MKFSKNGAAIIIILLIAVLIFVFMFSQYFILKKAHSTFEDYYAFRGCVKLLERTQDYGICRISSGQTIKIVKFQNKWYLDNDLPYCIFGVCI